MDANNTTVENVTIQQLKALRTAAGEHGDLEQAALADTAINGDDERYVELTGKRVSQQRALEACVKAINYAEAQVDA